MPPPALGAVHAHANPEKIEMDHFEYITMVISFVVAFAVSQILAGWARQYAHREIQPAYPLHTAATILFVLTLVQSVWGAWTYRQLSWTFGSFPLHFVATLPLAGAATLIHPPAASAAETSLRDHYYASGRAAYLMMAIWVALQAVMEWSVRGQIDGLAETFQAMAFPRIASIALLLWLARSKNATHHAIGLGLLGIVVAAIAQRYAGVQAG